MIYHLDIPESIASSRRLPASEIEARLRTELALALYAQAILPFGKATELAGVSRFSFAELASKTGRATDDLFEDAMAGYLQKVVQVREMLDRCYDDIKNVRVAPMDGEVFFESLRLREDELALRGRRKMVAERKSF
jgi:predicted HTH domain antitoxin